MSVRETELCNMIFTLRRTDLGLISTSSDHHQQHAPDTMAQPMPKRVSTTNCIYEIMYLPNNTCLRRQTGVGVFFRSRCDACNYSFGNLECYAANKGNICECWESIVNGKFEQWVSLCPDCQYHIVSGDKS